MNSKKVLLITLSSVFVVIALILTTLFIVAGMLNKCYYSNVLKSVSFKHTSRSDLDKGSKTEIGHFGKVTFLVGNSKVKRLRRSKWKKLTFGQHLLRGDSLRIGKGSKVEITVKNGKIITLKGFKKIRIDSSTLLMNRKDLVEEINTGNKREGGKISRLTGKEEKDRETSPVSAIRSNEPKKGNDKKTNLKTRIGG